MSDVKQVQNTVMTESDFNKSPLKNVMSYQQYFTNALKSQSAFTFAKFDPQSIKNNRKLLLQIIKN